MTDAASGGALLPPLALPHMHVDLPGMAVGARLLEAVGLPTADRPAADELVASQEYCNAVHQCLATMIPGSGSSLDVRGPVRYLLRGPLALERAGPGLAGGRAGPGWTRSPAWDQGRGVEKTHLRLWHRGSSDGLLNFFPAAEVPRLDAGGGRYVVQGADGIARPLLLGGDGRGDGRAGGRLCLQAADGELAPCVPEGSEHTRGHFLRTGADQGAGPLDINLSPPWPRAPWRFVWRPGVGEVDGG